MKSTVSRRRLIITITIVALIGFSFAACDNGSLGLSIDGTWDRGDIVIKISGSRGTFTEIRHSNWLEVSNRGNVKIGDTKYRNIKRTGDRIWVAESLLFNPSTFALTGWEEVTFTLGADGRTLDAYIASATNPHQTYIRR